MIRVAQLSTTDVVGGAALAAHRLHEALNRQQHGVDSTMYVGAARGQTDETVVEYSPLPWLPRSLNRAIFRVSHRANQHKPTLNSALFTKDRTVFGRSPLRQLPAADICHLHWISNLLDFRMLPLLARRMPIVWTMHDMNPFTGGCHYDDGCGRFTDACGRCPVIGSADDADVSREVLQRKERTLRALADHQLTLVSPSRWLANEARRSKMFGRFECQVIPNGIDTDFFRPTDPAETRGRLGLKPADRVVLFVADHLHDARKGWVALRQALGQIQAVPGLRVLTLGGGELPDLPGVPFCRLGKVSDPAAIRDAYNAADVFVLPSLQDNFPNTVLEALACGTPVVGFSIGGVVDAVRHGVTGLLAGAGNKDELAAHLRQVLTDQSGRDAMGEAARKAAVTRFDVRQQAEAYQALYQHLLQNRATSLAEPKSRNATVSESFQPIPASSLACQSMRP